MEKYLCLTALSELWKKNKDIFVLSNQCITYDNRHKLIEMGYSVIDQGETFDEITENEEYLVSFTQNLLRPLSDALNLFHEESHGDIYWGFILRMWLSVYIRFWYARYKELMKAYDSIGSYETDVYLFDRKDSPFDLFDLADRVSEPWEVFDLYAMYLYERIFCKVEAEQGLIVNRKRYEKNERSDNGKSPTEKIKLSNRLYGFFSKRCEIMVLNTVMGDNPRKLKEDLIGKVFFANGSVGYDLSSYIRDVDKREKILIKYTPENVFEEIILENIRYDIPVAAVEAYRYVCDRSKKYFKYTPKACFLLGGGVDPHRICAAGFKDKGSKIYGMMHAPMQTIKSGYSEREEEEDCDHYYVWGKPVRNKQLRSPTYKIIAGIRRNSDNIKKGRILWFMDPNKHDYRFGYYSEGSAICSKLEPETEALIRDLMLSIDYKEDREVIYRTRDFFGNGTGQRYLKLDPRIKIDDSLDSNIRMGQKYGGNIADLLESSSLIITESFETSVFFEAICRNVPTIIIENTKHMERYLTKEAVSAIEELKKADVLFEDSKSAAEFINGTNDFEKWWNENNRQKSIKGIVNDFFYNTPDTCKWWKEELLRIQREN